MLKIKSKVKDQVFRPDDLRQSLRQTFKNGKIRGQSTGIIELDAHFSWKKAECTALLGRPGHGKTQIALFLMLLKSIKDGSKWCVFSPENMTADSNDKLTPAEIIDELIQAYIGKNVDPLYHDQMSAAEYEKGIDFVHEHFFFIYPDEDHTPDNINNIFAACKFEYGIYGCLKDPWNQLDYDDSQGDYFFLRRALKDENKFAKKTKLANIITVHPSGKPSFTDSGEIKMLTEYDIAGGTMWANKMDNILVINRPYAKIDSKNPVVQFGSQKIKKQKLVGIPGIIELQFNPRQNRYKSYTGKDYIDPYTIPKQDSMSALFEEQQTPF